MYARFPFYTHIVASVISAPNDSRQSQIVALRVPWSPQAFKGVPANFPSAAKQRNSLTTSQPSMAQSNRLTSSGSSLPPPSGLNPLPSMTHSLVSLPGMSSLPYDMLHYNSALYSKAKMDSTLQKQRQQGGTQAFYAAQSGCRTPSPALNDDAHITVRRQQNPRHANPHDRR